jgi:hypothetical protein
MRTAEVAASGVTPFLTFPLKGGRNLEASLHILVCFPYSPKNPQSAFRNPHFPLVSRRWPFQWEHDIKLRPYSGGALHRNVSTKHA